MNKTYRRMEKQIVNGLYDLRKNLQTMSHSPTQKRVFVGFDGFVDTIMSVVKQKKNYGTDYFETIADFASRIKGAAGKSGQIELVTKRVKIGGNAPILSNTLGRLGIQSYCAGSTGYPERHPLFLEMDKNCNLITLCNPGDSRALEFADGKIIFSELSVFNKYDWKTVKNTHSIDKISNAVRDSAILAFVDWANLPFASEIWQGVLDDIVRPSGRRDFEFFFDLCDPTKKTTEQVDEVLDLMSGFSAYGSVTVGMNENETLKIWCAINGVDFTKAAEDEQLPSVAQAGDAIYKTMNIDCLLVHPIDRTIVFRKHGSIELKGRLVTAPKVLTGGGDNLNAGFFLGRLNDLPLPQCMLLGMATSGAYIQNGSTPDIKAIINYIEIWIEDLKRSEDKPAAHVFAHRHE